MGSGMLGPATRPSADSAGVVVAPATVGSTTEATEVHRGSTEDERVGLRRCYDNLRGGEGLLQRSTRS